MNSYISVAVRFCCLCYAWNPWLPGRWPLWGQSAWAKSTRRSEYAPAVSYAARKTHYCGPPPPCQSPGPLGHCSLRPHPPPDGCVCTPCWTSVKIQQAYNWIQIVLLKLAVTKINLYNIFLADLDLPTGTLCKFS